MQSVVEIVMTDDDTVPSIVMFILVNWRPAVPSETLVSTAVCSVTGGYAIKCHAVPSLAIPQG